MIKIIQDAGHGGVDPGAQAFGVQEKVWCLEASTYLNNRLNSLGLYSTETRSKDITLDSISRTNLVKESGATICLSHHFNAFNGFARGVETIYPLRSTNVLATKIAHGIRDTSGFPLRRVFQRKGANGDWYFMHRLTAPVETIIIEYGFLDNKTDFQKLERKEFRKSLYEAVVKVICTHFQVRYRYGTYDNGYDEMNIIKLKEGLSTKRKTVEKYEISEDIPGYMTASDAKYQRNHATIVKTGVYYIFHKSEGMINVTATKGVPGSWIQPPNNETTRKTTSKTKIRIIGNVQIVGVNHAAILMDRPDRLKAKNMGTIAKDKIIPIAGSVKGKNNPYGYWEVIYEGKRLYISGQFGRRV
ncbi:N-acetylmuramoyl-L-alanine amidase [Evansella sp. AB-P1]|uniref:N-acetylmuramoyl-L-alanine amidase family protein n=1 Tax=Evansella sp. AB-P1 TaxID=3037653 RepID=UPI00241E3A7D|nr:N-acetylmuramoyl-L-alanine amidase [Evansella sp. AB-P1]MDG5789841.1 N-acetylmuramoyl-L-alanine amidase [Evansella sp. AB-P1]